MLLVLAALFAAGLSLAIASIFTVPRRLSHIPKVPVIPLLRSYWARESEDERTGGVVVPFANKHGHSIVLVWTFGMWVVHIVDLKTAQTTWRDPDLTKERPPGDSLFWRFVGQKNILFSEGEEWKRHAHVVHAALQRPPPFTYFTQVAQRLIKIIGSDKKVVNWDEIAMQVTLDILGLAILGYDFDALNNPSSPFVAGYKKVLKAMTAPAYMFVPALERWLPRPEVERQMNDLRMFFADIIQNKKKYPGDDIMSSMIQQPDFGETELLDNMVVLFIAGHDTSSSALASTIYYLAKYPEIQAKARVEVIQALGQSAEPDMEAMSKTGSLFACIKESMRMNDPSNASLARSSTIPKQLAGFVVPPKTPIMVNIYAINHRDNQWEQPQIFDPSRFTSTSGQAFVGVSFSVGPRICPARSFALWELRTITALLLRDYEWSLPSDSIHQDRIHNGFAFGTSINQPYNLKIEFKKLASSM